MRHEYSLIHVLSHKVDLSASEVLVKVVIYPIAIPIAWILLNFSRVRANHVTFAGLLFGAVGAATSFFGGPHWAVIGYSVAYVLDFVDGRLARSLGATILGAKLDLLVDRMTFSLLILSLMAYHMKSGRVELMMALFILAQAYLFLDVTQLAANIGKIGAKSLEKNDEGIRTLRGFFNFPNAWIPSRLGMPVWGLGAYLVSQSCMVSYMMMTVVVVTDAAFAAAKKRGNH